jgi:polyisoprenoid-binding protein YceI
MSITITRIAKPNAYETRCAEASLAVKVPAVFQELMRSGLVLLVACAGACVQAAPRVVIPAESRIDFVVKEMGVPVHGGFKRFESSIDIDPTDPARSNARLKIDVGSLSTGTDEADAIAVGADWLDKSRAPYAVFKSSSFRALGAGRFEARGEFSLHNRTRQVVLQFVSTDQAAGKTLITSDFVIRRSEYGIGSGEWNEAGVVAEEIPVKVRLMLAAPAIAPK